MYFSTVSTRISIHSSALEEYRHVCFKVVYRLVKLAEDGECLFPCPIFLANELVDQASFQMAYFYKVLCQSYKRMRPKTKCGKKTRVRINSGVVEIISEIEFSSEARV